MGEAAGESRGEAGASRDEAVNRCDGPGRSSALVMAAQRNRAVAVRMLLDAGADPHVRNGAGLTPLHVAAWYGAHAAAEALLSGRSPSSMSAKAASLLRASKASSSAAAAAGKDGLDPAETAALRGAAYVDVRAGGSVRVTPLMMAAHQGHDALVHLLLAAGASVDAVADDRARTSLHMAAVRGRHGVAVRLLAAGANPTAVTADGETPADIAFTPQLAALLDAAASQSAVGEEASAPV
ncbi:uncharacterized protein AMSG_06612 [Thecamonas trahens ATCC 50062]|uniref:Uncharacterized protein n=1 Tax=Thecamonas trahens ATCC 50062 TaxID=461836 RepID=A0A0L0DHD7_THETB|nr:hypothetical protein AMSG_06612 [Thecamonas trahens ATCC 50062]KNC50723.1 hypothetical protein AMSG_06612 [Thecamonas trahens ATCC 50062]|eukprot:XP_013756692.1 hypothetical protein AMSG_06612 [Thecamonas trahens ATCC 50062]